MTKQQGFPLIGVFTANGAFLREARIRDLALKTCRPVVYLCGHQRLCGDCAGAVKGKKLHRAPLSRKTSHERCTACERSITQLDELTRERHA